MQISVGISQWNDTICYWQIEKATTNEAAKRPPDKTGKPQPAKDMATEMADMADMVNMADVADVASENVTSKTE